MKNIISYRGQSGEKLKIKVTGIFLLFSLCLFGSVTKAQEKGTDQVKVLYKQLIDAENAHDISAVSKFLWDSPKALFVAKTKTAEEGVWAGFWGTEVIIQHFKDLYKGTFRIDPDYDKEKVVLLKEDVAETYAPVKISVAYAGQNPVPKPFLMILIWLKTKDGWKMSTDIAIPIPPK